MQDAYETPFDRYETAVDVDEATEHLEARMDRLEARIDRLEVALDRIEVRLDRLERTMRRGMLFVMVGSMGWMALMVYLKHGGGQGPRPANTITRTHEHGSTPMHSTRAGDGVTVRARCCRPWTRVPLV